MTDHAMTVTMRYPAHSERRTAFQRVAETLGMHHGTIQSRSPWQNGLIERRPRTDHEECFHVLRFTSSEERQDQHRRWEMMYHHIRPHQGVGHRPPLQVVQQEYRLDAVSRMLM